MIWWSTANPTWGDNFESSKLKAQTSLFTETWQNEHLIFLNFELWNWIRKCHPKWDWLYIGAISVSVYHTYQPKHCTGVHGIYHKQIITIDCLVFFVLFILNRYWNRHGPGVSSQRAEEHAPTIENRPHTFSLCSLFFPTSRKKTCFDAGKIGFCHCATVLQTQVPKLCTDLHLSLLYILILRTYSKFARKNHYLALGVCFPQPSSSAGRMFAVSRSRLQYYWRIVSFPQQKFRWNAL